MRRSDSFSDDISLPASRQSSTSGLDNLGEGSYDLLEKDNSFKANVFGVVYVISKNKWDKRTRFAALRLVLDYLQLFVVLFNTTIGWEFDRHIWLYKVLRWVIFVNPVVDKGEGFFHSIFYLAVALMALAMSLCVVIGWRYQTDKPQWPWAVTIVKILANVFCIFMFPATLALFVTMLDCRAASKVVGVRGMHQNFHYSCLEMPHLAHFLVGLASTIAFMGTTLAVSLSDYEGNPLSTRFLAASNAASELLAVLLRAMVVIIAMLVDDAPKFRSIALCFTMGGLVFVYLQTLPYHHQWANHIRVALYTSLCWICCMMSILAFGRERAATKAQVRSDVSMAVLAGLIPAMVLGLLGSYGYMAYRSYGILPAFKQDGHHGRSHEDHLFHSVIDVEVAHRCCRVDMWDGVPDQENVILAEKILKAGARLFPNNAYMLLINASFVIDVLKHPQGGISLLQAAKKARPNICFQYLIFCREQEQRQSLHKKDVDQGSNGFDLLGYVEFQRNIRMVIRCHREASRTRRSFWKLVLARNVKFSALLKSIKRIRLAENNAERAYQMVLEKYPESSKLLRCYALYLQEIKSDPWSATKYFSEADRCEQQEEESKDRFVVASDMADVPVDSRNSAVVVINSNGIIQFVNKSAVSMFGYRKGELEGKNVSMLMPAPFSSRHNGYLRTYVTSGGTKSKLIGRSVGLVALHKDRYIFPIKIFVSVVSRTNDDTTFMGHITCEEERDDCVRVAIINSGAIVCVDRRFSDWFGMPPESCVGKTLTSLCPLEEQQRLAQFVHQCKVAVPEEFQEGKVSIEGTRLHHKYMESLKVDICAELGGTESTPIIMLNVRKCKGEPTSSLMVTDNEGSVVYATSCCTPLLGLTTKQLLQTKITRFIPSPFDNFHAKAMQELSHKAPAYSCRSGMIMTMVNSAGTHIPVKVAITPRDQGEQTTVVVNLEPSTFQEGLNQRRLLLEVTPAGLVSRVAAGPSNLFNFKAAQLVGCNVTSFLDVFKEAHAASMDVPGLLSAIASRSTEQQGVSWRVGVQIPNEPGTDRQLLTQVSKLSLRPTGSACKAAILQVEVVHRDTDQDDDETNQTEVFMLSLFRSDMLLGTMEIDSSGVILKAGACPLSRPGKLFGFPSSSMVQQNLEDIVHLGPGGITELLEPDVTTYGPSAVVSAAQPPAAKQLFGVHADGNPVKMVIKASSKDPSMKRLQLRIQLLAPQRGNLPSLCQALEFPCPITSAPQASNLSSMIRSFSNNSNRTNSLQRLDSQRINSMVFSRLQSKNASSLGSQCFRAGSFTPMRAVARSESQSSDDLFTALPMPPQNATTQSVVLDATGGKFAQTDSNAPSPSRAAAPVLEQDEWADLAAASSPTSANLAPPRQLVPMRSMEGTTLMKNSLFMDGPDDLTADVASVHSVPIEEASSVHEHHGWQGDYKAGKRYKRLLKQLTGPLVQRPMLAFKHHAMLLVGGLLFLHLLFFIIFSTSVASLHKYVFEVDAAGQAIDNIHISALGAQVLRQLHIGKNYQPFYKPESMGWWAANTLDKVMQFERFNNGLYLGFGKIRRLHNMAEYPIQDMWEAPNLSTISLLDTRPPKTENGTMSMWDLTNQLAASLREIGSNHQAMVSGKNGTDLATNRDYFFLNQNLDWTFFDAYQKNMDALTLRAMLQINAVNRIKIILLILEAVVACGGAVVYMYLLLVRVSHRRYSLFSVFLALPKIQILGLASRQSLVGMDDGDLHEAEEQEQHQEGALPRTTTTGGLHSRKKILGASPAIKRRATYLNRYGSNSSGLSAKVSELKKRLNQAFSWARTAPLKVGHKTLARDGRDTYYIMIPIMVWFLVVFVVYMLSYTSMEASAGPLINMNLADRVQYRITRVIHFAHKLAIADTAAAKEALRPHLTKVSNRLNSAYRGLLYGTGPTLDSHYGTGGSAFSSASRANYLFTSTACMRAPEDACLQPSSPFYAVSRDGIDNMMRRFISEALLLSNDAVANLTISSSRMDYIWTIGRYDLHHGFFKVTRLFVSSTLEVFRRVVQMHTTLLGLSWVAGVMYALAMFLPFCRQNDREIHRIAELLSQLPPEVQVPSLVEKALGMEARLLTGADKREYEQGGGNKVLVRHSLTQAMDSYIPAAKSGYGGQSSDSEEGSVLVA